MSTTKEFMEFVCGQIAGVGAVRYRMLFGEYMVYVNEKPVLVVCDNTVFIKMLPELAEKMGQAETGYPYQGAKPHYILDIDDAAFSREIVSMAEEVIPLPKPKKKRQKKENTKE